MQASIDFQQASGMLVSVIAVIAASGTALWIALIIWAFRDMRSRSRDIISQILAALVVVLLNIPGLLIYLVLRPRLTIAEQYERSLEEEALLQSIEDKSVCPGCTNRILDTWRICPYCHTRLKKQCANCSELLDLPWTICPYCETVQSEHTYRSRREAVDNTSPAESDST